MCASNHKQYSFMKFVQTCRLYTGLPNDLQDNDNVKAEGQTAKDRADQKVGSDQNAVGGVACVS